MYKVVKAFTDIKDNNHVYLAGDKYPREGVVADEKRVAELASTQNRRGEVLIKAQDAPKSAEIPSVKAEKTEKVEAPKAQKKAPKKANKKEK